jgi:hypothetical protein
MDSRLFYWVFGETKMNERGELKSVMNGKCQQCFRKDSPEDPCALYSSMHAGVELCLGPFKDQEDRLQKISEDSERETKKAKPSWERILWDASLNRYGRNKKLFDEED